MTKRYREIQSEAWHALTMSRVSVDIWDYINGGAIRYWGASGQTSGNATASLKLCVDRGDPFAKRLWTKIVAERLR